MGKSFKKAPQTVQPSDASIEQFVRRGTGKDTQKSVNTENMKRLTVDMSADLHTRYKIACTQHGLKMNDDIRQFIERRCAELES